MYIYNTALSRYCRTTANEVFDDDEVGQCTLTTIIEEGYDDIDDIIDDLNNYNDSNIISITSKKLMYIMDEEDKFKLYRILCQIFKDRILEIDINNLSLTHINNNNKKNQLIDQVINIIKKLNKKLLIKNKTIIDLNKTIKLFRNELDLNEYSLSVITATSFCDKAKKYSIPAAKAKKILKIIRNYFKSKENNHKSSIKYEYRYKWDIASHVEIFSKTFNKWCFGEIIKIFKDREGEWLRVRYQINEIEDESDDQQILYKQKSIQRYNSLIRPIPIRQEKNRNHKIKTRFGSWK